MASCLTELNKASTNGNKLVGAAEAALSTGITEMEVEMITRCLSKLKQTCEECEEV